MEFPALSLTIWTFGESLCLCLPLGHLSVSLCLSRYVPIKLKINNKNKHKKQETQVLLDFQLLLNFCLIFFNKVFI